jgi:hypothetical protein
MLSRTIFLVGHMIKNDGFIEISSLSGRNYLDEISAMSLAVNPQNFCYIDSEYSQTVLEHIGYYLTCLSLVSTSGAMCLQKNCNNKDLALLSSIRHIL